MTRILITGGSGFLGQTLSDLLSREHEVWSGYLNSPPRSRADRTTRFDIGELDQVRASFERIRPQFVVHTAALSKPDYCEQRPEETRRTNVHGTLNVARLCGETGAKLIHISSDLVFDGARGNYDETDSVAGISEYSRSKIEAERSAREASSAAVILRVSVMYGPGNPTHPGLLDEIMGRWRRGESMAFFTDQIRTPTFAPQVAEVISRIVLRSDVDGIFHLGGANRLSRFDFARMVAELVGASPDLLTPGSFKDHPGRARRGADCSLISAKITQVLGVTPMNCWDGLRQLRDQGTLMSLPR